MKRDHSHQELTRNIPHAGSPRINGQNMARKNTDKPHSMDNKSKKVSLLTSGQNQMGQAGLFAKMGNNIVQGLKTTGIQGLAGTLNLPQSL